MDQAHEPLLIFRPFTDEKLGNAAHIKQAFLEVTLPVRHLKERNWNSYRVYSSRDEFVEVEGEAVYDALAKSGVRRPYKIIRSMRELGSVLTQKFFTDEGADPVIAAPSEVPQSGIIAPPTGEAAESPASN